MKQALKIIFKGCACFLFQFSIQFSDYDCDFSEVKPIPTQRGGSLSSFALSLCRNTAADAIAKNRLR